MAAVQNRSGRRGLTRAVVRLSAVAALVALTGACGGGSSEDLTFAPERKTKASPVKTLEPASLRPGQTLPAPADEPVLTVAGKISAPNQDGALALDLESLDTLGVLKVRMYEPWAKKNMDFQGVWLGDLLEAARVDPSAAEVHLTALDDYQVDLTMDEVRAGGIFLATRAGDGSPIPIDEGGPTRIVFMDGVKAGKSPDDWIWSLKDVDVR